jgi:PEP-CTERM motif
MSGIRALAIVSLLLGPCAVANATVLYDNTLVTSGGFDLLSDDNGLQFNSFTALGSLAHVDTVQVLLSNGGVPGGSGNVQVAIYNNSADAPGSLFAPVGSVSDTNLTSVPKLFTFGGSGANGLGIVLPGLDDRFWIGLSDPLATTTAAWSFASDASGIGVAGEFTSFGANTLPNSVAFPFQMCVSNNSDPGVCAVAQAPEPGSLAILGLSLAGFGLLRRRR